MGRHGLNRYSEKERRKLRREYRQTEERRNRIKNIPSNKRIKYSVRDIDEDFEDE